MSRLLSSRAAAAAIGSMFLATVAIPLAASADTAAQPLPYGQDWSNQNLITADDNWTGVPGAIGYRGDGLTAANDVDPRTVTADGSAVLDVIANQTSPNTLTTGGVAEFHEPAGGVVAIQGSGTADAPHLVFTLDTTGASDVTFSFVARDVDGSADNAAQQIATQYRVGTSGAYTDLPAGYIADATTGPDQASAATPVTVTLPAEANNQPVVQTRVITTNATGSDEWVGIDDVTASGSTGGDQVPVASCGGPLTTEEGTAVTRQVTARDADDRVIDASLTVTPPESGITLSNVAPAQEVGGTLTADLNVSASVPAGTHAATITFANDDAPAQTATCEVAVEVTSPPATVSIHDIQGAAHRSPLEGQPVANVEGIVTAVRSNGFWFQDPVADADVATSEGLFVFTSSAPGVAVGDAIEVDGTVAEFRPGGSGGTTNLTTTELVAPAITVSSAGNPLPSPETVGEGGRVPPGEVIEDDATGDVETSGVFDPGSDGIDFYESLEGMRVQVNDALAVGPRNDFGEIPVLGDEGRLASVRTPRGGIVIRPGDFNPERIILDDVLSSTPSLDVADVLPGATLGVMDYSFGNFKLLVTSTSSPVDGGLTDEVFGPAGADELAVASYNIENFSPADAGRAGDLAHDITYNLGAPDIVAVQEVQDDNGPVNDSTTSADLSYQTLVDAIVAAGGPRYEFTDIDPVDDQDGGQPGGNIRVGFLYRIDRGLEFVSRPGGTATTPTTVVSGPGGPQLSFSPGRIDPNNPAFLDSRKPLAGEFEYNGERLFVINNHFNSKGGDDPLFGRFQPPRFPSEVQRRDQAQIVNDFVGEILAGDPDANVFVVGDLNDFWFSDALDVLKGEEMANLAESLPVAERYSYIFEGNSQTLDHILVADGLADEIRAFDYVHINSEFAVQTSDHDPPVSIVGFEPPGISIADGSVVEGDRGPAPLELIVTLDRASAETVSVSYATTPGTARARKDYLASSGVVTFEPGETTKSIVVQVIGDRKPEPDETFGVQLSTPSNAVIVDGAATATIVDDDRRRLLPGLSLRSRAVGEGARPPLI